MNEINLNMPIPPGIMATLKYKLPSHSLKKIVITGVRFDASEAKSLGVVDEIHPANSLE